MSTVAEWQVIDAQILVHKPDNDPEGHVSTEPDVTIPREDILSIDVNERVNELVDSATFDLQNTQGRYGGKITPGDRFELELYAEPIMGPETEPDPYVESPYSEGAYSEGGYSGNETADPYEYGSGDYGAEIYGGQEVESWVGVVRDMTYSRFGPLQSELTLDVQDFPTAVLSWRFAYEAFEDRRVVGEESALVDTLLRTYAPEVSRTQLPRTADTAELTDLYASGENVLDLTAELAALDGAVLSSRGNALGYTYLDNATPQFRLEFDDVAEYEVTIGDGQVANDVRVDGGSDYWLDQRNPDVDDPTPSSYSRVTDTNRLLYQLAPGKEAIDRVEIWVRRNPDATNGLNVRLQRDKNGAPQNPNEPRIDLAKHQLAPDFLSTDSFTTFLLPDNNTTATTWLIIEGVGEVGHDIGVDTGANPLFRSYYPYPISLRVTDRESQQEYRHRQHVIKDNSISTFEQARRVGETHLQRNRAPEPVLTFEAWSSRAKRLRPGDVIDVWFPDEAATGEFIVTERRVSVEDVDVSVRLSATHVASM